MPIYEYACAKCGELTEVIAKIDDPPPAKCPHCGATKKMSRVVSKSSFQLKGGGWYSDLYGSKKPSGGESKSSGEKSGSKSGGKSE